ncbi:hypothetical protein JJ691_60590 [Kutzneria sp. CA-103260]|nr:hypothetical protein JJ691_60590 [Kutzneria sp. CA-103260]
MRSALATWVPCRQAGQVATTDVSTELASQYNLPGALGITRHRTKVFVELDIPLHAERINEALIPAVEALCLGFVKRMYTASGGHRDSVNIHVGDDYVAAWASKDDLDHLLVALSALLAGAGVEGSLVAGSGTSRPA